MKRLKNVPPCVIEQIKSDHQRAMDRLFNNTHCMYHLPIHAVAMRIQQPNGQTSIKKVIIPAIVIHLTSNAFITPRTLNSSGIKYSLQSTHKPFPFGHIYQDSGHVCLGDIFIPSSISCHSPQQPLETLFLYNDRNVNHGQSTIVLTQTQITQIMQYLEHVQIKVPNDINALFIPNYNLVHNDAVWVLSAHVLKTTPSNALSIMQEIFDIIFSPEPHTPTTESTI